MSGTDSSRRAPRPQEPCVSAGPEEETRPQIQPADVIRERSGIVHPHVLHLVSSEQGHHHDRLRIGIMGGTFDPIHIGHLVAASEVSWQFDLDEVIFVPTGRPVFKLHQHVTSAEDRYLMTVIATSSNPRFTVSRVDIDRPGITYTIDTLRDMHRMYPDADLFFITGADAIAEIFEWKDADKMWDLAHFVAVTRPGYSSDLSALRIPKGAVDLLEIPALAISSTDVRRRASRGEPVRYLVPDGVVEYITKHGLYVRQEGTPPAR